MAWKLIVVLTLVEMMTMWNTFVQCQGPAAVVEVHYLFEEEQPIGTVVSNVVDDANLAELYDAATLSQLRYRFLKQLPNNVFDVDDVSGVIQASGRVDREELCSSLELADDETCDVQLDVVVQPLQFFRIIRVTITVTDVNDHAPTFTDSERVITVPESAAVGSTLLVPEASDLDGVEFGVQSYNLVTDADRFMLTAAERRDGNGDRFVARLVLAKPLDRELEDSYHLQIVAVDGGIPPKSGTLDVNVVVEDVNDNSPVFDHDSYEASLPEDVSVGTTFVRIHAADYDEERNGEVVYSLSGAHRLPFDVNNVTGDVYVSGVVDHEERSVYRLTVKARDRGTPPSEEARVQLTVHVVDLNDNAPTVSVDTLSSTPGVAEIAEGSAIGSFVAHLSVFDADAGSNGRFTCDLRDEDAATGQRPRFALTPMIGGADGEFQVRTTTELDHEQQVLHELTVVCSDYGTPSMTSVMRVVVNVTDINDNDPQFVQSTYSDELIENNYVGAEVLIVRATDRDDGVNGQLTYSVDGDAAAWFDVEPTTGVVKAGVSFDRESNGSLRFYVVARDAGTPQRSASALVTIAIVDVNDERPTFSQTTYKFSVMENLPAGASVGSVAAVDRDLSIYGQVTYIILPPSGGDVFGDTGAFRIDARSGALTTTCPLDREKVAEYRLRVNASDRGVPPLASTTTVIVYVGDENDNPPVFLFPTPTNRTVHVSTRAHVGHVIARLTAVDPDYGKNGALIYGVTDETRSEYFDVDTNLGAVIVNRGLGDVDGRTFALEVVARDNAPPHHSVSSALYVSVNRTVAFVGDPGRRDGGRSDSGSWFHVFISSNNVLIVVVLSAVSAVIAVVLIIAICVVIRRQDAHGKQGRKYNCRTEALRVMQSKGGNGGPDAVTGTDSAAGTPCASNHCCDGKSKHLCLAMEEQRCNNEQSLERSGQSWPSTIDNQVLQNPQACSSLLTDTSSAVNGCPGSRRPVIKPATNGDFNNLASRAPVTHNREIEVNRLLKALQRDANETDSDHSGDGSNTDSGRGPSEEGETARTKLMAAAARDGEGSGRSTLRKFPQHSVIDELSDASNQVVPDTSCVSGHSYSDHPVAQNHLSTFGASTVTPTSRRLYGRYTGRNGSASLTDVTDNNCPDRGFVVTASPAGTATLPSWCADRRQQSPLHQQVPAVRYASTACVDALRQGELVQSPTSPSTNRRNGPPVLRKPAISGYPGNGCHESACRLLGDDDCETGTTLDDTPYSCADVSAALRDVVTPVSVCHQHASSTVNPHELCDEIDELFFKT